MIDPDAKHFYYYIFAAISGAVTSLAFMDWKRMNFWEIALTVFGGFSFALIVVPPMAHKFLGIDENSARAVAGFVYLGGCGWHILIPRIIRWMGNKATGDEA